MRSATVLFACFVFVEAALGSHGIPESLGPKTYTSPSGTSSVRVDPSDRQGTGQAAYVLRRNGETVWEGEHPITLREAVVLDDGTVAGYAYTQGYDGSSNDLGDLVVAILRPDGSLDELDRAQRSYSPFLHVAPDPKVAGLFVDADDDRLVVRVDDADVNESTETWWVYRISTGERLGRRKPAGLESGPSYKRFVVDAQPVPATPLVLVHWYRSEWGGGDDSRTGARFTLLDLDNRPVWTLDLPDDYTDDESARDQIRADGAILGTSEAGRFEIRVVREGHRVSFEASPDPDGSAGWKVVEVGRGPFAPAVAPKRAAEVRIPRRELPKLGSIDLAAGIDSDGGSAVRVAGRFDIDDRGRFGLLVQDECREPRGLALDLVDSDGRAVTQVDLPVQPAKCNSERVAWLGGDRWLVTVLVSDEGAGRSAALVVDVATGGVTALDAFEAPWVSDIAALPDGGFVALTAAHEKYTITETLVGYAPDGHRRWEVTAGTGADDELFSPEDIAVTTAGDVVVLQNVSEKIEVFGPDGRHRSTIDLAQAWGRKPSYPAGIERDGSGGVVVYDFNGEPSIVRMTLDGEVVESYTPRFGDGRRFTVTGDVRMTADGSRWTSDGHALLRLDATGTVEHVLGSAPSAESISEVASVTIGPDRHVYAMDGRTGAVHVFDEAGSRLQVCRPEPDDYEGRTLSPSLTVTDAGEIFASRREDVVRGPVNFVHYAEDCRRVGVARLSLDHVSQKWHAQRGSTRRWVVGFQDVYLVDDGDTVLRRIQRTHDGQWLERPGPLSVAPDGSIAFLSHREPFPPQEHARPMLTLVSASGDSIATWDAPSGTPNWGSSIAYDGARVAFAITSAADDPTTVVVVTDLSGTPQFAFEPSPPTEIHDVFLVERAGTPELWIFAGASTITRYGLNPVVRTSDAATGRAQE